MKVRVCIAVDDEGDEAFGVGDTISTDMGLREEADREAMDSGFKADRYVWVDIEIPPPPETLKATAQAEETPQ